MSDPPPEVRSPASRSTALLMALVLVGALGLLLFPRIGPPSGLWWETGWNALHFPGFILITVVLERLQALFVAKRGWRIFFAAAGAFLVATGSEVVQGSLGRSSSIEDVIFDSVGIVFAVLVLVFWPRSRKRGRRMLAGLGAFIVMVLLTPGWKGMLVAAEHRAAFPDLGMFSKEASLARWRSQGNAVLSLDTSAKELQVTVGEGRFSGVSCYPSHGDWREYKSLHLVIENPGTGFRLGIRVDDDSPLASRYGERYQGEHQIEPGRNDWRIPLSEIAEGPKDRTLDLSRIKRLALFTGLETDERVFTVVSAFLD